MYTSANFNSVVELPRGAIHIFELGCAFIALKSAEFFAWSVVYRPGRLEAARQPRRFIFLLNRRHALKRIAGMTLQEWQTNWDKLGKDDPLWIVLTAPGKEGGKWDPEEFFATGREEIDNVLAHVKSLGLRLGTGKALDFGCGVGRLTQALARYFDEAHGVDISPSMLEHARNFNQFTGKAVFHLNSSNKLEDFDSNSIDFVYSNIALQHIEQRYQKVYLAEFFRVLKPGGVAAFQMITAKGLRGMVPESLVKAVRRMRHGNQPYFGMFGVPEDETAEVISRSGAEIKELLRQPFPNYPQWLNMKYVVQKKG